MPFPRADFINLLADILPEGATISWSVSANAVPNPGGDGKPILVNLRASRARSKGVTETRRTFDTDKNCYSVDQRGSVVWSIVIDVETFDGDMMAEDVVSDLKKELRWGSAVLAIQTMGLTTIKLGDVIPSRRVDKEDERETSGAVMECQFGQCDASHVSDDDGEWIETFTFALPDLTT